jgi:membrane protease YdiL (CAAX protease family)
MELGDSRSGPALAPPPPPYYVTPPPPPPAYPATRNAPFPPPKLDRPTIRRELIVVLLVFPALATITAIITLVAEVSGHSGGGSVFDELDPTAATILQVLYTFALAAPLALVWYLLGRSGLSFKSIGLDRSHLVRDIVMGLLLMLAARFLSNWIGEFLFNTHVPGVYGTSIRPGTSRVAFIITGIATSVVSGVVEEVVVLGYLTNRLRGLGWAMPAIAIVSLILRGSYHVEYGIGVLQPLVFGAMMTAFYLQTRRLLPVIIGHVGYDIWVTLQAATYL